MTRFTYSAEKTDGEVYKSVTEARDRFELYQMVRNEGARIISVTQENSDNMLSFAYWNSRLTTVSEYEKVLFARNLGSMLAAGLPLARALSVMERQIKNPRMAATVSQISSDVRRGEPLHAVLAKSPNVFSRLFVAMAFCALLNCFNPSFKFVQLTPESSDLNKPLPKMT